MTLEPRIRLVSNSLLFPETSKIWMNVSSEHVAKIGLKGWHIRALSDLEWALTSQRVKPVGVINFTDPLAKPAAYKFIEGLIKVSNEVTGISFEGLTEWMGFHSA